MTPAPQVPVSLLLSFADTFSLPTVPSTVNSVATATKTLPSVAHVPLLIRWIDFGAWNEGVCALILYLGYLRHIAEPPVPGVVP